MTPEHLTRLQFQFASIKSWIEIKPKEAQAALLALIPKRNDYRIWAILEMVCSYDAEDSAEKKNIERTILEILRNKL